MQVVTKGYKMSTVTVKDKEFELFIQSQQIASAVSTMAAHMNLELKNSKPLFLAVLNGSFLFAADLLRNIKVECEISFVKLASYQGMATTGNVNQLIGMNEDVKGRTVVILEDIVDTGTTLEKLFVDLESKQVASIKVAALLFKPEAYTGNRKIDYVGIEVPNNFLVGYGLDYDGQGRNLEHIYTLIKK